MNFRHQIKRIVVKLGQTKASLKVNHHTIQGHFLLLAIMIGMLSLVEKATAVKMKKNDHYDIISNVSEEAKGGRNDSHDEDDHYERIDDQVDPLKQETKTGNLNIIGT
jgi:hypothetical protein